MLDERKRRGCGLRYPTDYLLCWHSRTSPPRIGAVWSSRGGLFGWVYQTPEGEWDALLYRPSLHRVGTYCTPEHAARRVYEHATETKEGVG